MGICAFGKANHGGVGVGVNVLVGVGSCPHAPSKGIEAAAKTDQDPKAPDDVGSWLGSDHGAR